ncbi:uncharacterized protein KD926_009143 [Aspergillus affinis]|uniref:uncharacterized protein n=1 Tax=Aspergillus affinis TaxID=1070780 RepID=UPI0022FEE7E4|nr:uncharacterized protein KD926_009143 [Aspergillus affinis]KAI9039673.1 hypothetical protein KD926_009143 [Aspergillus affinis]
MKFLTILALLAPALAQITCETSNASPKTEDVTGVINQLNGKKSKTCAQNNNHGSKCTTHATDGSAKIAICGTFDSTARGYNCGAVAGWANAVQQTCLSNGKVGGYYVPANNPGTRIEISHT